MPTPLIGGLTLIHLSLSHTHTQTRVSAYSRRSVCLYHSDCSSRQRVVAVGSVPHTTHRSAGRRVVAVAACNVKVGGVYSHKLIDTRAKRSLKHRRRRDRTSQPASKATSSRNKAYDVGQPGHEKATPIRQRHTCTILYIVTYKPQVEQKFFVRNLAKTVLREIAITI